MEPGLLNDAEMREEVKYKIEGEEHRYSVSFYVASMTWSNFGRLIHKTSWLCILNNNTQTLMCNNVLLT